LQQLTGFFQTLKELRLERKENLDSSQIAYRGTYILLGGNTSTTEAPFYGSVSLGELIPEKEYSCLGDQTAVSRMIPLISGRNDPGGYRVVA